MSDNKEVSLATTFYKTDHLFMAVNILGSTTSTRVNVRFGPIFITPFADRH